MPESNFAKVKPVAPVVTTSWMEQSNDPAFAARYVPGSISRRSARPDDFLKSANVWIIFWVNVSERVNATPPPKYLLNRNSDVGQHCTLLARHARNLVSTTYIDALYTHFDDYTIIIT